ncbi:MAG: SUMF1/EgtB/PvdO family nonheme iron enzyme [Bradymonadales bacterium]|nr:SUMF1/EgtB/PvdO family nonheme iron enzyme [Bradymonadales bacterium]
MNTLPYKNCTIWLTVLLELFFYVPDALGQDSNDSIPLRCGLSEIEELPWSLDSPLPGVEEPPSVSATELYWPPRPSIDPEGSIPAPAGQAVLTSMPIILGSSSETAGYVAVLVNQPTDEVSFAQWLIPARSQVITHDWSARWFPLHGEAQELASDRLMVYQGREEPHLVGPLFRLRAQGDRLVEVCAPDPWVHTSSGRPSELRCLFYINPIQSGFDLHRVLERKVTSSTGDLDQAPFFSFRRLDLGASPVLISRADRASGAQAAYLVLALIEGLAVAPPLDLVRQPMWQEVLYLLSGEDQSGSGEASGIEGARARLEGLLGALYTEDVAPPPELRCVRHLLRQERPLAPGNEETSSSQASSQDDSQDSSQTISLATPSDWALPGYTVPFELRTVDRMPLAWVAGGRIGLGLSDVEYQRHQQACLESGSSRCQESRFERERPQVEVEVPGFWLDRFEVSRAQYARCVAAGSCAPIDERQCDVFDSQSWVTGHPLPDLARFDQSPRTCVQRQDAESYCQWVGGRLPSEAEWELAASGAEGRIFAWGDDFDPQAVAHLRGRASLEPAYSRPSGATPDGIYHMSGNAYEWVAGDACGGPGPPEDCAQMGVIRGGCFASDGGGLRTTYRRFTSPAARIDTNGFRCAMSRPEIAPESDVLALRESLGLAPATPIGGITREGGTLYLTVASPSSEQAPLLPLWLPTLELACTRDSTSQGPVWLFPTTPPLAVEWAERPRIWFWDQEANCPVSLPLALDLCFGGGPSSDAPFVLFPLGTGSTFKGTLAVGTEEGDAFLVDLGLGQLRVSNQRGEVLLDRELDPLGYGYFEFNVDRVVRRPDGSLVVSLFWVGEHESTSCEGDSELGVDLLLDRHAGSSRVLDVAASWDHHCWDEDDEDDEEDEDDGDEENDEVSAEEYFTAFYTLDASELSYPIGQTLLRAGDSGDETPTPILDSDCMNRWLYRHRDGWQLALGPPENAPPLAPSP